MAGGMVFRKDCQDCGRSFFSPDRRTRLCPRCTEAAQKRRQPEGGARGKDHPKPPRGREASGEPRPRSAAESAIKVQVPPQPGVPKKQPRQPNIRVPGEAAAKRETPEPPAPEKAPSEEIEIILTKDQEQEVVGRYQAYVERMERPPGGRRKTIAAEMGIPFRAVLLAVRNGCQWRLDARDLSREERFALEKAYFRFLKEGDSLQQIKERIIRETGFSYWQVSRYLDLLHDGEDRLSKTPDVTPEQTTAILAEYDAYLSSPAPPEPPLHALIAARTGVEPKQAHKVLLAYRLRCLRERTSR